ncbi:MAG TPA: hypothetical protein VES36_04130, partial [Candidatus Limnocylindrales bacterium]|nr:hypothetical protein [Candidatus Limnocylindrales bacterium]
MLTPDWFGTVNSFLGPVNYLNANQGSACVALPLAVLGLLYGRPRRLALGAGALFGFGLLAGLNAPGIIQLLGVLPLFSVTINSRLALYAMLAMGVLAGLGLDSLHRTWPSAARLRLLLAVAAPALGAWLGLVAGVRAGLITDNTVPTRLGSDLKLQANLVPRSTGSLQWTKPAPEGEGKLLVGWVAPSTTPVLIQLLYNARQKLSVAQFEPLPDSARAAWRVPEDIQRPVYAVRALLPPEGLPPGPTAVQIWVSVMGGSRPEVTDVLRAPDDPGFDQLAFPAQPAEGWFDFQLMLVGATLVLTVASLGRPAAANALRPALAVAVVGGLFPMLQPLLPFLAPDLHFPDPPALELLKSAAPNGRMLQMIPHTFAAEVPTYYGLYDVRGYDALCPWRVARLLRAAADAPGSMASVDNLPTRNDVDLGLLGLMSVQYLTDWSGAPRELPRVHYPGEDTLPRTDPFPVTVNPQFLPRARLVSGAVILDDDDEALAALG